MPSYKLFLFGAPRLEQNGEALPLSGRKLPALLAYLAATAQPQSRDLLATLFWPEFDQSIARANLRRELSGLRTIFDPTYLKIEREQVSLPLGSDLWLDVAVFQARWHECQQHPHGDQEVCPVCLPLLQEAADLYTADFLAGFSLSACPEFDEWQYFQAEGYRRTLATVLDRLVRGYGDQNEAEAAIAQARRRLTLDPLDEAAQRQLIALYAETGNRTAALRQVDLCVQLLQDELGAPPDAETAALIERIRHSNATPVRKASQPESSAHRPVQHNLPTQTTAFIGREAEMAEIKRLLLAEADCRLLTLVGPGGIGKTRLALATATQTLNAFTDGACFVSLAPVSEVEFLVAAIADALRFSFHGAGEPKVQLLDYLRPKQLLLVVDNFEHLLGGADLLSDILRQAPHVTVLATARERLNLQEEWVYTVEGLAIPAAAEMTAMPSISEYSAVALFVQRARQVVNGFSPTPAEMTAIVRICQLVEGMPLGLELAAPWVRTLSCREIAQEMQQNLDFLTTSLRNLPERHRSLRAVLAQSWQRVTLAEQTVLQGLSVFRGGCTREAAEQVTGARLDVLKSLVDKAFLYRTNTGRYELHELMRQYSAELLSLAPEGEREARNRHCAYYTHWLQRQESKLKGANQAIALAEIEADIQNIRNAWQWAVMHGQIEYLQQTVESLNFFYHWQWMFLEGENVCRHTIESLPLLKTPMKLRLLAQLLAWQGVFNYKLGNTTRQEQLLQHCIAVLDSPDLVNEDIRATRAFALLYMKSQYKEEAKRFRLQSLALYQAINDKWGMASAFNAVGAAYEMLGIHPEGEKYRQESLQIWQEIDSKAEIAAILANLGLSAISRGDYHQAEKLAREGVDTIRTTRRPTEVTRSLRALGTVLLYSGQFEECIATLKATLAIYEEAGRQSEPAVPYVNLGFALIHSAICEQACTLISPILAASRKRGNTFSIGYCIMPLLLVEIATEKFAEAATMAQECVAIWEKSSHRIFLGQALALSGLAAVEVGNVVLAQRFLDQSIAIGTKHQTMVPLLYALPTAALLALRQERYDRAIEIYASASRHPHVANSCWFRDVIGQHISKAGQRIPSALVCDAEARGQKWDLWEMAKHIIE